MSGEKITAVKTGADEECRLCAGATRTRFRLQGLGARQVGYHECLQCGSLQTDRPTWLEEAYSASPPFDAPTIARASYMQSQIVLLAQLFPRIQGKRCLDVGGGCGMLGALLKEAGFDAFHQDPFAPNMFAPQVVERVQAGYGLITCIEVWEHFAEPAREIAELFAAAPELLVVNTNLWREQGAGWGYLYPSAGQHVFFYAPKAMRGIAERYGYDVYVGQNLTVFSRTRIGAAQRFLLRRLNLPLVKALQVLRLMVPRYRPE